MTNLIDREPHVFQSFISIKMEEFKAIRNEILRSMIFKFTIITLGMTIFSCLFSSAFNFKDDPPKFCIHMGLIMIFNVLIYFWWLSECVRQRRAGQYIRKLEKEINSIFNPQNSKQNETLALNWEHWLRNPEKKTRLFKLHYNAVILMLAVIFATALVALVSKIVKPHNTNYPLWLGVCAIISLGWTVIMRYIVHKYIADINDKKNKDKAKNNSDFQENTDNKRNE